MKSHDSHSFTSRNLKQIKSAYLIRQEDIRLLNESVSDEEIRAGASRPAESEGRKRIHFYFSAAPWEQPWHDSPPKLCRADHTLSAFFFFMGFLLWVSIETTKSRLYSRPVWHVPLPPLEPSNGILEQAERCQVASSAQSFFFVRLKSELQI